MKLSSFRPKHKEHGFTLFQLIAIIVVLGLIAATAVQVVVVLQPSSWEGEARAEMEKIKCAITGCVEGECGFIGNNAAVPFLLEHLLSDPGGGLYCNWLGPYLDVSFVDDPTDYLYDPWGDPYIWDSDNLTLTSTAGGETDPITIQLASDINELLNNSVRYNFVDENGNPLTDADIDVFVNYGCGDVALDYDSSIGFYGDGFPACGLQVKVISPTDTLYPPTHPPGGDPDEPIPVTCDWGNINYEGGSASLSGTLNESVSFDVSISKECTFQVTSVTVQWSGSTWCNETPYLERFRVGGTYWDYEVDNNGVRAISGQEIVLRNTLNLDPGSPITITDLAFANSRTGPGDPIQMDGSDFVVKFHSNIAPTQVITFNAGGTPPTPSELLFVNGSQSTSGGNCDVTFDIMNPGECCIAITEMIVEWDTLCAIPYLEEVKIDGDSYWQNDNCKLASGQYLAFTEPFVLCNDVVTVKLNNFRDDRGSAWGDDYSGPSGGSHAIGGGININPNNSSHNEFYLVKSDGDIITRDDLHETAPGYNGGATWVHVKPKGNGNQNSLTVDGSAYAVSNSTTYDIESSNMTVDLYNDNVFGGQNMGQWWIDITATNAAIYLNGPGYYDSTYGGSGSSHGGGHDSGHGGGGGSSNQNRWACENEGSGSGSSHGGGGHGDSGHGDSHGGDSGSSSYSPPDCPDDDGDGKITICHYPPGNPANMQTLCISVNAWEAHKAHGDDCGPCSGEDAYECSDDPDYVGGNGDCLDMRGHSFTVTLIELNGTEHVMNFSTASVAPANIVLYNDNYDVSGSGNNKVEFDIRNTGDLDFQISKLQISWSKSNAYLEEIELDNSTVWDYDNDDRMTSGAAISLERYYLVKPSEIITVELKDFRDELNGSGDKVDMEAVDFDIAIIGVTDNCDFTITFTTPGTGEGGDHGDDHGDDHDDDHDDDHGGGHGGGH